jgi:23S rRNA (uracil1939-C5)-methyltransferase
VSVTILEVTHHGMGRGDDGALYPRTLPGEVIEPGADGLRILTPSPARVAPPCRHFRTCGGCAMQHASDAFVSDWKAGIVRRALAGQGLGGEVDQVVTSPPRSRTRAKLAARRTKSGALVGFHARASDQIVATPDCQLLDPALQGLFPALADLTRRAASRTSELALTLTATETGPDLAVSGGPDLTPAARADLAAWAGQAGLSRLTWGDQTIAQAAPPAVRLGPALVTPPPGAFLQATPQGQAALAWAVRDATRGAAHVVDLFAGCGTFSLPLAEQAQVHAVEGEGAMLAALDRGWRATPGLKRVTTEVRDLFRNPLMPEDLARFDAAVIDPPRAGAEAQVAQLASSRLATLVMVSCNPVTFARDARILTAAGWRMGKVTVVDQFRWSSHVELVSRFTRA